MNYEKYLAGKCSHRAYYAQFVSPNIKEVVRSNIGIKALLASRVPAFNDIPLERWDELAMPLLFSSAIQTCTLLGSGHLGGASLYSQGSGAATGG